jgi:penicillin-binding protein 1B
MKTRKIGLIGGISLLILAVLLITLIRLDFIVTEKFDGTRWKLPSLVYARPSEIYPGMRLDQETLEDELAALQYQPQYRADRPGTYSARPQRVTVFRQGFHFWDEVAEATRFTIEWQGSQVVSVLRDGQPVSLMRLEPMLIGGIYPDRFEDRQLIKLAQVPQHLIDALLLTEDRGFYDHFGIEPRAILRAIWVNIKAGGYVQGASTLTQQLVKNFYLNAEQTLKRKIIEAVYALLLEWHYSKDEILAAYLNEVYFGQQGERAIHGVGLASDFYFGVPIEQLSVAQSALLVAVVNGPSYYNPRRHPERCLERRNLILGLMLEADAIDQQTYDEAVAEPLKLRPIGQSEALRYPAYLDLVRRHLSRDYRSEDLQQEGLRIFTAFNPYVQNTAQQSLSDFLETNSRAELDGAAVVINASADVEAIVGGKMSGFAGFNRALDARRSIGSLVKPAILLTALEDSANYQLTTPIDDSPLSIDLDSHMTWSPENYDKVDHGEVPLFKVVAKSYNQASARLGMELGPDRVAETLQRLGASSTIPTNPAMLLGSMGMSPFEVTEIYHTISSGGFRRPLRTVRYVMTGDGETVKAYAPETSQAFAPEVIHLVQYALQAVMQEGTGQSAYQIMDADLLAAGKTGTSNDRRDSWFVGYTGDKLVTVWMGRDDNRPTPLTGSSGSLQVWARIMDQVSREPIYGVKPAKVVYKWIDEQSGLASFEVCQDVRQIPFIRGSEPQERAPCVKSLQPVVDWLKNFFD